MDGNAIVYCQDGFNTPNGKTAHGLVRFTNRYNVIAVIDSKYNDSDAREVLDGVKTGIKVVGNIKEAIAHAQKLGLKPTHFVVGLAPDGGRLPEDGYVAVKQALASGLNVDSGLHDFLSEDGQLVKLAAENNVTIRDIRKPPHRNNLHFFTGDIENVKCLKLAVLGTDSAIGKRTTAWIIVNGFNEKAIKTEMVGTGQTAWMQGAKYYMIMDSIVNDFVSGEIEHAVVSAWRNEKPKIIVIEGQGSLMNPAYPGGFEILAAGRPDYVILQHAPARKEYDGFPGYPIQPLKQQINAIEVISGKKVIAITVNHENLMEEQIPEICASIQDETGIPAFDVLLNGPEALLKEIENYLL